MQLNSSLTRLVAAARLEEARLGAIRLVLVDGPAGSGKTTLAARLAAALGGAQVLHSDDMYEGWSGLATLREVLVEQVFEPLARGEDAGFAVWDWASGQRGEVLGVPASDFLVIEGVGVAQRDARPFASLVVYVEAPWAERLRRGIERDGEEMRAHWERWQLEELEFLAEHGTREAADAIVDGAAVLPD